MKLHQFDPHIAVIDDAASLRYVLCHEINVYLSHEPCSVWDWSKKKKVVTFNNGNPTGSAITGVHFVNEDAQTMILTASGMSFYLTPRILFNIMQLRGPFEFSATTMYSAATTH